MRTLKEWCELTGIKAEEAYNDTFEQMVMRVELPHDNYCTCRTLERLEDYCICENDGRTYWLLPRKTTTYRFSGPETLLRLWRAFACHILNRSLGQVEQGESKKDIYGGYYFLAELDSYECQHLAANFFGQEYEPLDWTTLGLSCEPDLM